jgi:hypothetical protein
MAFNYSPKVITDGLVLYLDAANTRSYPGSGTAWNDLSRSGNNGTLTNGPTFNSGNGGSIVFDGVDDFVSVTGSITVTAATFVTWLRRNGNQDQYDGILFSRGANTTGMNFQVSNQLGYHWNDAGNTYNWQSGLTIPNLTWCMIAVSVTSSSAIAYLCQSSGITSATNSVSHASTTINALMVGRDSFSSRYFNGNIAQSLIYNRALSSTEILQNYNATKTRFGL